MTHHTAEQAKKQHVAVMGESLGRVYDELQQECWRLQSLWNEYRTLSTTVQEVENEYSACVLSRESG